MDHVETPAIGWGLLDIRFLPGRQTASGLSTAKRAEIDVLLTNDFWPTGRQMLILPGKLRRSRWLLPRSRRPRGPVVAPEAVPGSGGVISNGRCVGANPIEVDFLNRRLRRIQSV